MNWSDIFSYDPETGILRWKIKPGKSMNAGSIAGCKGGTGHLQVRYKNVLYYVHRIAYEISHGEIPKGKEIDHINRNKIDNRLCNLRLATHMENIQNSSMRSDNTSGFVGVSWEKRRRKWESYIILPRKQKKHLGYFHTKEEAYAARVEAEKLHHGEFAQSLCRSA